MSGGTRSRFFWSVHSRLYDALWDNELLALLGREIAELLPPGAHVLQIGSGTGIVTQQLVRAGHAVVAAEPDRYLARRLLRRLPGTPLIACELGGIARSAVSHVLAVDVVHAAPEPIARIRLMQSRCGPRGQVVIAGRRPHARPRAVAWAQFRAGTGIWRPLRFIALQMVLGPLARACGVSLNNGSSCVADDLLRNFEIDWRPRAEILGAVFRLLLLPAGDRLSDPS